MDNQNPQDIFIKILTIADYSDDKQAFAQKFIQTCQKQAVVEVLNNLPKEDQQKLAQLAENKNPSEIQNIISGYISKEDFGEKLKSTVAKATEDYLKTIIPILSKSQQDELKTLLRSITATNST